MLFVVSVTVDNIHVYFSFVGRTKSNFGPVEQAACEAGLVLALGEDAGGQGDAHSDDTVLISAAELGGQVVNEVEIAADGNDGDQDPNEELDVNEVYAYKKKKTSDNFEQQVVDL